MTLFKQIALLVSLVFLLLVTATTIGDFRRSGAFLEGQLQTAAQDMTTTLGIAISNSSSGDDLATLETLFNAVFDSGYYTRIELLSPDGELIHKKEQQLVARGVPDWFISLVPLRPATGSTQIMRGWIPLGDLTLTLHPGFAYVELYENLKQTLLWFVALFVLGLGVLWYMLHSLLQPLDKVKQQADAIHSNQFVQQDKLPRTPELRSVVEAMNRMIAKVHVVFEDQEKTLARYQQLLYVDELTGLGNRQYMLTQLQTALSEGVSFHGHVAVIKIHDFMALRDQLGYDKADALVSGLASVLNDSIDKTSNQHVARFNEDEFALLLAMDADAMSQILNTVFDRFKQHADIVALDDGVSLTAGMTTVHTERKIGEVLSEVDFALTQAAARGAYHIHEMSSTHLSLPQGKMQWRSWLEKSLADNRLFLVAQPVITSDGSEFHQEVYVRLKNDDEQIVPAGMFMPMALALGFGLAIDKRVFELVKDLGQTNRQRPVAVNLTASFFNHADAFESFNQLLEFYQQHSAGLCVEASHMVLQQFPDMCTQVAQRVRQAGHKFGIDNLDLGHSLQVLQTLQPDYVKINARMLYDMTSGDVPVGYQALQTMTNALDIRLIAVAVDSQELYDRLGELGVDAMQGNLLCEPKDVV